MNRDTFNALVTAVLMVIGLIALNPAAIRGDRHSTSPEPCDFLNTCSPDLKSGEKKPPETPEMSPNEHPEKYPSSITATQRKSTVNHQFIVD
ncbi:MAG: hypothetical protein AAGA67_06015 [Cyanobacteria bacterium P01_F01_bin.153]